MLRPTKLVLIGMLFVLMSAGNAAAKDWWGWLEEFSGPGPFEGPIFGASLGQMLCFETEQVPGQGPVRVLEAGSSGVSAITRCIWADGRFLTAPEGDGFPATDAYLIDAGFAWSYKGLASAGVGAGIVRLVADTRVESTVVSRFTVVPRFTVSFVRVVDAALDKWLFRRPIDTPKWEGFVKFYYKPTYVAGELSAADVGAPRLAWSGGNELRQSYGISFDFLEFSRSVRR
jgi:hypothetical protein